MKTLLYFAQGLLNQSKNSLPQTNADQGTLNTILNLVFITIGGLALLFIVIAGFRFVVSGDEPNKVAEARRMIIYAVIGLVLAGSAAAIVNVVLKKTS
jgi:type IV secretion system pilin